MLDMVNFLRFLYYKKKQPTFYPILTSVMSNNNTDRNSINDNKSKNNSENKNIYCDFKFKNRCFLENVPNEKKT